MREHARLAENAGNLRERLQVIGPCPFGREEQKGDIHRLAVEGVEIHRAVESGEQPEEPIESGQLAVGNRHPITDAGRSEPLALEKGVEDGPLAERRQAPRRLRGEILQHLLLGAGAQGRHDRLGVEKFQNWHRTTVAPSPVREEAGLVAGASSTVPAAPLLDQ